jgi:hypothetical protein
MSLLTYQNSKYIPITIANLAGNINNIETYRVNSDCVEGPGTTRVGEWGEGVCRSQRSQISLPSRPECMKTVPKRLVSRTFFPKNHQKRNFLLKST